MTWYISKKKKNTTNPCVLLLLAVKDGSVAVSPPTFLYMSLCAFFFLS